MEFHQLPTHNGFDLLWVNADTFACFHDYAQVVDFGDIDPRLLDVASQSSLVQMEDDLFPLSVVEFVLLYIGIHQYIVGISTGEVVQQFVELTIDISLESCRSHLESERQNVPSEGSLSCVDLSQVTAIFVYQQMVESSNDVDLGHLHGIAAAGDRSIDIWR